MVGDFFVSMTLGSGVRRLLPQLVDAFTTTSSSMSRRNDDTPARQAADGDAGRASGEDSAPRPARVLVGPGIGRDAAVIDIGGGRCLVAKTDPVTFAAEQIGWYAVHVNANDIACMGARPAWFLATALLTPARGAGQPAGGDFDPITSACEALEIDLVGGHTEGSRSASTARSSSAPCWGSRADEIVHGENIEPGDVVLMTKCIAIEGTALLAREASHQLANQGVSAETIPTRAQHARSRHQHRPGSASAVRVCAAAAYARSDRGGLATALYELATAASMTLRADAEAVPVLRRDASGMQRAGSRSAGTAGVGSTAGDRQRGRRRAASGNT